MSYPKLYLVVVFITVTFALQSYSQSPFDKVFTLHDLSNVSVGHTLGLTQVGENYYSYGAGWDDRDTNYTFTMWVVKSDAEGNILDYRYLNNGNDWMVPYGGIYNRCHISQLTDSTFVLMMTNGDTGSNDVFCIDTNLQVQWITPVKLININMPEAPKGLMLSANNIYTLSNRHYGMTRITKMDYEGNIQGSVVTDKIQDAFDIFLNPIDSLIYVSGYKDVGSDTKEVEGIFDRNLNLLEMMTRRVDTIVTDLIVKKAAIENSADLMTCSFDIEPGPWYNPEETFYGFALNISRRDKDFNILWNIKLCGPTSVNNGFSGLIPSLDGNYFVLGQVVTFSEDIADLSAFSDSLPVRNHLILKVSPDGEVIWRRQGCSGYYELNNWGENSTAGIVAMDDGGVMVNGLLFLYDSIPYFGKKWKGWMMRLDKDGCLAEGDCAVSSVWRQNFVDNSVVKVWPNPGSGLFTFDGSMMSGAVREIAVLDSYGRYVKMIKNPNFEPDLQIDISAYPSGIYFFRYRTEEGKYGIVKAVKTR